MLSARSVGRLPFFLLLSGCQGCSGGTDDSADAECVLLQNENNYAWTGGLVIPEYITAEKEDIKIDFSALTDDMLCHEMDPVADVDNLGLTRFPHMDEQEVSSGLTNNSLLQSNTNGYVSCEPGDETFCMLSDFSFGGTAYNTVEVYEEAGGTFLIVVANGYDPGQGALFLAFLKPTPGSDVTEVYLTPTCDVVDYDVDLTAMTHLALPAAPSCIDWSGLTIAGNGEPVVPGKLDEILIGHYTQTPDELDDQFTDIELLASEFYTLELTGGTDADLTGAASADGTPFGGFTTDGTWLLGLRCTSCTNPAPIFMTVVDPT